MKKTPEMLLFACEYFRNEAIQAIDKLGRTDISLGFFPSRCGRPPIVWSELTDFQIENTEPDHILVLGGCCLSDLDFLDTKESNYTLRRSVNCFSMFTGATLCEHFIKSGSYLLTPAWLSNWREELNRWGFDQETAREFFKETASKLTLLDTGISPNSLSKLSDMAEFVDLPTETIPVGLDHFNLFLANEIKNLPLNKTAPPDSPSENTEFRQMADYAMALDLIGELSQALTEDEIIDKIVDTFFILFAPGQLNLLSIVNGRPSRFLSIPTCQNENEAKEDLSRFNKEYSLLRSGNGFRLRIGQDENVLAVIELNNLTFPEYLNHYMNLGLTLAQVCALALENVRKLEQIQQSRKMEAIGTLAAGIAHDFNNLLQSISGYTQFMLLDKGSENPEYHSLMAIKEAGQRAADLVRQLLQFSRKAALERKPVSLHQEVERVIQILKRTIPKMIDVELQSDKNLWTINADSTQIEQILLNLSTNAADAMPDGGRLLFKIENIKWAEEHFEYKTKVPVGQYVLLSVIDSGHGMDQVTIERIFDPFFTTKSVGKGTGLGLASVYGIVKSHGGYIVCHSKARQGTTFEIIFPAISSSSIQNVAKVECEVSEIHTGSEIVLLVDDEEAIRDLAKQALMKFGFKVISAFSGEQAIEVYKAKPDVIDLILMDLGMPGMGGYKCLKELLKLDPHVKVVIASGYSFDQQVKQAMDAGAASFIGKPYKIKDLINTVRMVLDH